MHRLRHQKTISPSLGISHVVPIAHSELDRDHAVSDARHLPHLRLFQAKLFALFILSMTKLLAVQQAIAISSREQLDVALQPLRFYTTA